MPKKRTNWHEAAVCAVRITLRDYDHLLEYHTEYPLARGALRIDLLLVTKPPDAQIPHSIARIFRSHNLFEVKGIHSHVSVNAYYKTISYATLLIAEYAKLPPLVRQNISLTFLCSHYPRKLIRHLTKDCKKTIANPSPGIYYINEDIFPVQILVTGQLPPKEALYLRCMTDQLTDEGLINCLAEDYSAHQDIPHYEKYMNQITNANLNDKGGMSPMCCEGIFRLYGTSSQEIAKKAAKEAADQQALKDAKLLKQTTDKLKEQHALELSQTASELDRLKALLDQHHIAYE